MTTRAIARPAGDRRSDQSDFPRHASSEGSRGWVDCTPQGDSWSSGGAETEIVSQVSRHTNQHPGVLLVSFPESLAFGMLFAATCLVVGKLYGHWRLRTGQFQPEEFSYATRLSMAFHCLTMQTERSFRSCCADEAERRNGRSSSLPSAPGCGRLASCWGSSRRARTASAGLRSCTSLSCLGRCGDTARRLTRIRALLAQVDARRRSGRPAHSSAHSADTVRVHRRSAS